MLYYRQTNKSSRDRCKEEHPANSSAKRYWFSCILYIDAGIAYRYSAGTAQEIINSKQDTTFLKAAPISQFFSGN
jgi:hypothetical protein